MKTAIQEWTPQNGERIWVKVFSNWSSATYIGFDNIKKVHIGREDEDGGGAIFSSNDILPYSAMPNSRVKRKTAMQEFFIVLREFNKELYDVMDKEGILETGLEKEKEQSINLIKQTCMFMGASIIDIEISKMEFEDVYDSYYNQGK